jgi:uncharacterized membrane protein YphA (DoxX/SURF4 family)
MMKKGMELYARISALWETYAAHVIGLIARVSFGLIWVSGARWKMPPNFGLAEKGNLYTWVSKAVEYPVFKWYAWLTEHVILPNFLLFAWFTYVTEILLAVSFLTGYKTKWFAALAFVQSVAIGLSVAKAPNEWVWTYVLMAVVSLVLMVLPTNPISLDALLKKRKDAKKSAAAK